MLNLSCWSSLALLQAFDVVVHQECTCTFPCVKWDVRRGHLQWHGTKPHTWNDCPEIAARWKTLKPSIMRT